MKAQREAALASGDEQRETFTQAMKAWLVEARDGIKENWFLIVYMVFLMTGFNSTSHGSQDLYPTFLKNRELPREYLGRDMFRKKTNVDPCAIKRSNSMPQASRS